MKFLDLRDVFSLLVLLDGYVRSQIQRQADAESLVVT